MRNYLSEQDIVVTILSSQLAVLRLVRMRASEEGLTMQQFGALRLLMREGSVPMIRLSEELRVSAPVVTGIVDRLEKKGLLRRRKNAAPLDRRRTEIVLTETGSATYKRIQSEYRASLREILDDSLSSQEQGTLKMLLDKLGSRISEMTRNESG